MAQSWLIENSLEYLFGLLKFVTKCDDKFLQFYLAEPRSVSPDHGRIASIAVKTAPKGVYTRRGQLTIVRPRRAAANRTELNVNVCSSMPRRAPTEGWLTVIYYVRTEKVGRRNVCLWNWKGFNKPAFGNDVIDIRRRAVRGRWLGSAVLLFMIISFSRLSFPLSLIVFVVIVGIGHGVWSNLFSWIGRLLLFSKINVQLISMTFKLFPSQHNTWRLLVRTNSIDWPC